MEQVTILRLKKDKYYEYLKENSHYVKDLNRQPQNYELFKNFVKELMPDIEESIQEEMELTEGVAAIKEFESLSEDK